MGLCVYQHTKGYVMLSTLVTNRIYRKIWKFIYLHTFIHTNLRFIVSICKKRSSSQSNPLIQDSNRESVLYVLISWMIQKESDLPSNCSTNMTNGFTTKDRLSKVRIVSVFSLSPIWTIFFLYTIYKTDFHESSLLVSFSPMFIVR